MFSRRAPKGRWSPYSPEDWSGVGGSLRPTAPHKPVFTDGYPRVQPCSLQERASEDTRRQVMRNKAECPRCPAEPSQAQSSQGCPPAMGPSHPGTCTWNARHSLLLILLLREPTSPQRCDLPTRAARLYDNPISCCYNKKKKKNRTSLVAQWIRIHLTTQRVQVQSLVQEDSTCLSS